MTTKNYPRARAYTVILLRPDYIATQYGQDTWMGPVKARDPQEAVKLARGECWLVDTEGMEDDPEDTLPALTDYFVIAVIRGKHNDLNPGV